MNRKVTLPVIGSEAASTLRSDGTACYIIVYPSLRHTKMSRPPLLVP